MIIARLRRGAANPVSTTARCGLAAVLLTGLVAACAGDDGDAVPPSEIGHVHDLIVDENQLLVATHRGFLRLDDIGARCVD